MEINLQRVFGICTMVDSQFNSFKGALIMAAEKKSVFDDAMVTNGDLKDLAKSFKDDLIRVEDKLENKISSVESGLKSELSRVESSIKGELSRLETVLKDTIKLEVKAATSSLTTKVNFIISVIMLFAVPSVGYIVATFLKQYFPWG